ncbi:hypothetical protein GKZ89_10435 [Bacillus mangrovi]|uniref:Uncharacterized protein n=1 Tax=Metabacillus mangrovi TaxID=1491830 RepID=A0A7X2V545_9BACI|nr:hypothetical protein [Metabacillus mangrovi]MTH53821.1 hypothetical protein [Metabacillus mangrovi]
MLFRRKKTSTGKAWEEKLGRLEDAVLNMDRKLQDLCSRKPAPIKPEGKPYTQPDFGYKLNKLENDLAAVKEQLNSLKAGSSDPIPAVYIQNLHVQHVDMKEVDLSNNFGSLGIKDLPGQLNIGTVYGKTKDTEDISGEDKQPKVSIQAKKD